MKQGLQLLPLFLCLLCPPVFAQSAGRPSAEQIARAITEGAKSKKLSLPRLRTGGGAKTMGIRGGTIAVYATPLDRVLAASYAAAQSYRPFTTADVTEEMIAPELHIYAYAMPIKDAPVIANVVTVVVMPHDSKDRSRAIQPTRVTEMATTFRNLLGCSGEGTGRTAVFPLEVLSKDNAVHVVFDRDVPLGSDANANSSCTDCRARFELKK